MKNLIVILTLVAIFSCTSPIVEEKIIPVSKTEPDTTEESIVIVDSNAVFPKIFNYAFTSNYKTKTKDLTYTFQNKTLGQLNLSSGKIIATDPILLNDSEPFTKRFPKGSFPVDISIANKNIVAFVKLTFSNKRIKNWKYALLKGEKDISITDTSLFYCFSVDAGVACLFDAKYLEKAKSLNKNEWDKSFFLQKPKYESYISSSNNIEAAVFETGYGDGCYATFIGYDEKGQPSQLLIDFGIIEWWKNSL